MFFETIFMEVLITRGAARRKRDLQLRRMVEKWTKQQF
jgi:hypothetical protein